MSAEQNSTISETALVKQQPVLKKRQLSLLQQKQHNFSFGHAGEAQAKHFLTSKEFVIVDTNVRFKHHEVDIIAIDTKAQELVFIEVKTRSRSDTGHPSLAINKAKIASMQQVARQYLQKTHLQYDYRFDSITITVNEIEHFENISWGL